MDQVKTVDDIPEQTPTGIPATLRPFFQEYVLEELDPERSATVLELDDDERIDDV